VSSFASISLGLAKRNIRKMVKQPLPSLTPLLIPLFMFAAFVGAMSGLADTKSFDYYSYTAFQFVFVVYLASMLTGGFSAFEIATDYEMGFGNRLMLGARHRMAILVGYILLSLVRWVLTVGILWGVALGTSLDVKGGALDIAGIMALALLLNLATILYASGVALRLQSTTAGALITVPIFVLLFLSPVFVPQDQLSGWLSTAADIDPLTPVLEAGRGFLAGDPVHVAFAFGVLAGLVAACLLFAIRGMVRAGKGPKGERRRRGPGARRERGGPKAPRERRARGPRRARAAS
jgi:ABC-2 type transport system permease protein